MSTMNPFKDHMEDFDKLYEAAVPCTGYATVQVSARKVLILKENSSRGISDGMRTPMRYDVLMSCANMYLAENYIRRMVKGEAKEPEPK